MFCGLFVLHPSVTRSSGRGRDSHHPVSILQEHIQWVGLPSLRATILQYRGGPALPKVSRQPPVAIEWERLDAYRDLSSGGVLLLVPVRHHNPISILVFISVSRARRNVSR